ncbi:putative isomerase YbhE [Xylariaceae sp. FL0662B]|nr:putative isomerase YbhE [Xylariaceae sp. FL0662B]
MIPTFTSLLTLGLASATPFTMPRQNTPASGSQKLIIGASYQILTADFNGSSFSITGNHTIEGEGPSWLLFKDPNLLYAVNENGNDTNLLKLKDDKSIDTAPPVSSANGSAGVVFLEFNKEKTRMVGAGYSGGTIDVFDVSKDGLNPKPIKTLTVPGEPSNATAQQAGHHPHQALLDPTGRFFVIPNLGGDTILVLNAQDDKYEITGNYTLKTKGAGPRHGGFITTGENQPTYYVLACEISSDLMLFELEYASDTINFKFLNKWKTYGADAPPANLTSTAAGELVVANNMRDVYVSNRLTGNDTGDSIAHFTFERADADADKKAVASLNYQHTVSSTGIQPRMFSLSTDDAQSLVFVANQGGDNGLVAFGRCNESGTLDPTPLAAMANKDLIAPQLEGQQNVGPAFVKQI